MGQIDTTSLARILLAGMGQGSSMFNAASGNAQAIMNAQDSRQFRDKAFAAQEAQRAFGNDLATKDQAIQQAAADRAAQAFPLSQRMAQTQLDAANFQFAERQRAAEEDAMIGSVLAPRVANKILELSAAKYGVPRFDDQMRAYAISSGKVSADGMSYLLRNLNEAADLDKLQSVAKKHRSLIQSTLKSSAVTPEAKAQGEGLLAMLESENPATLREAIKSSMEAQQQQAAMQQQTQLGGMIQSGPAGLAAAMNPENGPPITLANQDAREQYVANAGPQFDARQYGMIAGDAGLRTMYNNAGKQMAAMGEQIMQPTVDEQWQQALRAGELEAIVRDQNRPQQERFAAAAMLNDMGYKTASNMPGQERAGDGGVKQIESRLGAIRSAANSLYVQLERSGGIDPDTKQPVLTKPENNARWQQLQQLYAQEQELAQQLAGAILPPSSAFPTGVSTSTSVDTMRSGATTPADALRDSITADLTAQLGRPPTDDESLAEFRRRKALRQSPQ